MLMSLRVKLDQLTLTIGVDNLHQLSNAHSIYRVIKNVNVQSSMFWLVCNTHHPSLVVFLTFGRFLPLSQISPVMGEFKIFLGIAFTQQPFLGASQIIPIVSGFFGNLIKYIVISATPKNKVS